MGHKYAKLMFTAAVKDIQRQKRSRDNYAAMEQGEDFNYLLSAVEAQFISERNSCYMASVSETNWPYVQHRGGPAGFIKVIDAKTIGFADFSGNRQYISTGNFSHNNCVSLLFMDYPNRRRLKLIGRVEILTNDKHPLLLNVLKLDNYRAKIERGFIVHVEAFDWNCPQFITPRFDEDEVEKIVEQRLAAHINQTQPVKPQAQLGDGPLALVITAIKQLTPQIRAYELRSANEQALPRVSAGSHMAVPVQLVDGSIVQRHYSLCSDPGRGDIYEIAVLNKPQGKGGSAAIHQSYQLGMQLNCSLPGNYFDTTLAEKQAVILIAGGIGITPIKALAYSFLMQGVPLHLHYAGKSLGDMAFSAQLSRVLGENISLYPAAINKRLDVTKIMQEAPESCVFYACGPDKLLQEINEVARQLSIPVANIRTERFSPVHEKSDKAITVSITNTGHVLEVGAQQSILDALISTGIDVQYSCKTGQCKQCVVELVEGQAEHRDSVLSDSERETHMCLCVSRAKTAQLTIKI